MTQLTDCINRLRTFACNHRDEHKRARLNHANGARCQLCSLADEIDRLLHPTREILSIQTRQKAHLQIEQDPMLPGILIDHTGTYSDRDTA